VGAAGVSVAVCKQGKRGTSQGPLEGSLDAQELQARARPTWNERARVLPLGRSVARLGYEGTWMASLILAQDKRWRRA
jgi:hypothetical protein